MPIILYLNFNPDFADAMARKQSSPAINITDDITEALDNGLSTIMVLLDYSRAFDSILPELLVGKSECYDFSKDLPVVSDVFIK